MENKDILKESDIKNCTSYYFDDINLVMDQNGDFGFSDILSNEKLHKENNTKKKKIIHYISYKTSMAENHCILSSTK